MSFRPRLISLARKIVRDRTDAEEVADEALARWAREIAKADFSVANAEAWLTQTAMRLSIDRARAWARHHPMPLSAAAQQADTDEGPAAKAASAEMRELIWRAVLELPRRQQEVVVLRQMHGQSYREISDCLGIQESTARNLCYTARESLRRKLVSQGAGDDPR